MSISKFLTLREWEEFFGGRIRASSLRSETRAGRLRCVRVRPGCNSPILISEQEMERWLKDVAGQRQMALSPMQARKANQSAGQNSEAEIKPKEGPDKAKEGGDRHVTLF